MSETTANFGTPQPGDVTPCPDCLEMYDWGMYCEKHKKVVGIRDVENAFHEWAVDLHGKIVGVRFGQWFCNKHGIQDSKLFYMTDAKAAYQYICDTYLVTKEVS